MLEHLNEATMREACRLRLEAVELWLRRLAHDALIAYSPDYLQAVHKDGSRLIKKSIADDALSRIAANPTRYPRGVDALLLDEIIEIICKPKLWPDFRQALSAAYPDGPDEARTFLRRLVGPRNRLAHANALSLRQAEQVICYTGDIIASLKEHYAKMGQQADYNVPLIMRVIDSLGNSFHRSELPFVHDGGIGMFLHNQCSLRPGDVLTVEIEVDPNFLREDYKIEWSSTKPLTGELASERIVVPLQEFHAGMQWTLQCRLTTNKPWHRMDMGCDDFLLVTYRVLPPP